MMMNKIPEINRARGYYVYTASGKRYLDMALEGGRLVMGHRQKGYAQAMKNAIDKGILPGYPSPYAHRLKQAVKALLEIECFIYLFKSEERARQILSEQNLPSHLWWPFAPAICKDSAPQDLTDYDPIGSLVSPALSEASAILLLPVPADFAPGVVISDTELPLEDEPVSPVILAGAVRAIYNLIVFRKEADYSGWEKAGIIDVCKGKWIAWCTPYIFPFCKREQYTAIWDAFFEAGIILSTDYDKPSVLPPYDELSDGMQNKLLKLLSEY